MEIKEKVENLIKTTGCKIYGDHIIGYRAQLEDGSYIDGDMFDIEESCDRDENKLTEFADACFELRSGGHNWQYNTRLVGEGTEVIPKRTVMASRKERKMNKYEVVEIGSYRVELSKYGKNDWCIDDVTPEIEEEEKYGSVTMKALSIVRNKCFGCKKYTGDIADFYYGDCVEYHNENLTSEQIESNESCKFCLK